MESAAEREEVPGLAQDAPKARRARAISVKCALMRAGVTQAEVARDLGVTCGYVSQVVSGLRPGLAVRAAIAARLGMDVDELWDLQQPAEPSLHEHDGSCATAKASATLAIEAAG